MYVNGNNVTYFYSFGVKYISKEIKKLIGNKKKKYIYIYIYIFRIQACNSIMCGYFYIGSFNFTLKGKSLLDYTNIFSPNKYEKTDKIMLKDFQ